MVVKKTTCVLISQWKFAWVNLNARHSSHGSPISGYTRRRALIVSSLKTSREHIISPQITANAQKYCPSLCEARASEREKTKKRKKRGNAEERCCSVLEGENAVITPQRLCEVKRGRPLHPRSFGSTHTLPETSVCNYSLTRSCFLVSLQVWSQKIWLVPKRQIFFLYRGNHVMLSGFQMSVNAAWVGGVRWNPLLTVLGISCEVFLHCSDEMTTHAGPHSVREKTVIRVLSENRLKIRQGKFSSSLSVL